jgi:type IV fimbrial biogenesis protein FimT
MNLSAYSITLQRKQRHGGFTLIEIMVAIGILGILTAIAVPSFTSTIKRFRAEAIRDELVASIQVARSEAIRTRRVVFMVRRTDCAISTATASVWSCGWQIVSDTNGDNINNAGDTLVQQSSVQTGFSVANTNAAPVATVTMDRYGMLVGAQNFVIAPLVSGTADTTDTSTSAVCVGAGGKILIKKGESVTCVP